MKFSALLLPLAACFANGASATTSPLTDYLSCADHSFAVVGQPPFTAQVPHTLENGHLKLQGGSTTDLGRRWMFDTPVEVDGLRLTGFYAEDLTMMGSRIISWGFYVQQTPEQMAQTLRQAHGIELEHADGIYARPQIWDEQSGAWQPESSDATAGKLVTDTAERVLLLEPAPKDLPSGSKGMLTCSLQGKISAAALNTSRPDLKAAE